MPVHRLVMAVRGTLCAAPGAAGVAEVPLSVVTLRPDPVNGRFSSPVVAQTIAISTYSNGNQLPFETRARKSVELSVANNMMSP
jgi:hypothetical protein